MAGGIGVVHYPQQPSPSPAQVGSAAEAAALQQHLAALARTKPGFLPYRGAGIGGALQSATPTPPVPGAPEDDDAGYAPPGMDAAESSQAPPSIGAALMQRKGRQARHLQSLGMPPAAAQTFTSGRA